MAIEHRVVQLYTSIIKLPIQFNACHGASHMLRSFIVPINAEFPPSSSESVLPSLAILLLDPFLSLRLHATCPS